MKLTIIGSGKMASAITQGLEGCAEIEVLGRKQEHLDEFSKKFPHAKTRMIDNPEDLTGKTVILATKPESLEDLSKGLKGRAEAVISVLAGRELKELKELIESDSYARAMPNLAAAKKKSATAMHGDEAAIRKATDIFSRLGEPIETEREDDINIATAIAGSGPAFLAVIAQSIEEAGEAAGLSKDESKKLTQGLFEGFTALYKDTSAKEIKEDISTPGGTTEAGLAKMELLDIDKRMKAVVLTAFLKANSSLD